MNISGGGVAKHSPNRDAAVQFLEFLTKPTAQRSMGINFEYPVSLAVSPGGVLQSFGDFKRDELAIEKLAELAPAAEDHRSHWMVATFLSSWAHVRRRRSDGWSIGALVLCFLLVGQVLALVLTRRAAVTGCGGICWTLFCSAISAIRWG